MFGGLRLCLTTTPVSNFNAIKIHYLSSKGTVGTDVFSNDYLELINIL